jgi:hypothetical protein
VILKNYPIFVKELKNNKEMKNISVAYYYEEEYRSQLVI